MNWGEAFKTAGFVSVMLVLLVPPGLAVRWVVILLYRAYLTWKRDRIELEALRETAMARARAEQLVHLKPDPHGFGGVVYDQREHLYADLDTGAIFEGGKVADADAERTTGRIKQGMLAAISGSKFYRTVNEIIHGPDERPKIEISDGGEWLQLEAVGNDGGEVEI